jgi:glyoxylase-like metal-dependent hydrolase (beta-lactamase superfamily II)
MSTRWILPGLFVAFVASTAQAATPVAPGIELVRGVTSPGSQPDGNSIIIDAPDGLIVFDTGRHVGHTQQIVDYAKEAKKPIVAIVNSHWHLDHIGGNRLLRAEYPDAQIYAGPALAEALGGFLASYRQQLADQVAKPDTDPATRAAMQTEIGLIDAGPALAPTDVIGASRSFTVASRELDVHLERAVVTGGDVWVFDPQTRVLLAGDLVTLPAPFFDTACPQRWQEALGRLATTRFSTLVPGHGPPMNYEALQTYRTAFDRLLACAAGDQPKPTCVEGWVQDAGDLVAESDHAYARGLVDYYLDAILRGNAEKVAKLCAVPGGA